MKGEVIVVFYMEMFFVDIYNLFESVLCIYGYVFVKIGNVVKIVFM